MIAVGTPVLLTRGNRDLAGKVFSVTEHRPNHPGGEHVLLDGWLLVPADTVVETEVAA